MAFLECVKTRMFAFFLVDNCRQRRRDSSKATVPQRLRRINSLPVSADFAPSAKYGVDIFAEKAKHTAFFCLVSELPVLVI